MERPGTQNRLLSEMTALPLAASIDEEGRVLAPSAPKAPDAVGPTRVQQDGLASLLGSVLGDQGAHGHAGMDLGPFLLHYKGSVGASAT